MVIQPVTVEDYHLAAHLFTPLTFHLAVDAVLAGATPGRLWLDDVDHPRAGLMQVHHRFYLSGDPQAAQFAGELRRLFAEEIFPHGRAVGKEAFTLYFSDGWEQVIEADILRGVEPIAGDRLYYECSGLTSTDPVDLAHDLRLVAVDRALLDDGTLTNLDGLVEEMQSERSSVEEFFQSSFGVCLRSADQIVTWCLSEYNLGARCEVGIATEPGYRQRGLAAWTGAAFLKLARARGCSRIGWHCWASNEGSWRTALKIGFQPVRDYPSCLVFFQPAVHFAVMGDILLNQGCYAEALVKLERAIAPGDGTIAPGDGTIALSNAPGWAYLDAACAAARLDDSGRAMDYLKSAALHGINHARRLMENEHLAALHGLDAWRDFIKGLPSG